MRKKLLATLVATTLIITGCSGGVSDTADSASRSSPQTAEAPDDTAVTPASAEEGEATPTPTPTKETHKLGEAVDRPQGASVTAHDYQVVTDVAGHKVGAIDVEVCVGNEGTPEGAYVTTEFWTAVSDDNRRYGDASTTWRNEEISPILDMETDVSWGDCLRGWIVTDASDDSNITKIRYFNDYSEEAGNEEIIWDVPQ